MTNAKTGGMAKPYTNSELFLLARDGKKIDPLRCLATYADENNWGKIYDDKGCHWVWQGPVICAFELAQWVMKEPGGIER